MFNKAKDILHLLKSTPKEKYYFKNISSSVITIIKRSNFKIDKEWFDRLLSVYFDYDIKSKYDIHLHQDDNYSKEKLKDILNFKAYKNDFLKQIKECQNHLNRYRKIHKNFYDEIQSAQIAIIDADSDFFKQTDELINEFDSYRKYLDILDELFKKNGYEILPFISTLKTLDHSLKSIINFNHSRDWHLILDKEPEERLLRYLFDYYNEVYYNLNELNSMVSNYILNKNHKIIIGNAGMGKSHLTAHLVNEINNQEDYVVFLKPKFFNGDNINFDNTLLQLFHVPNGYTLEEILLRINNFSKSNGKRSFIIIDALNETTKSSIGFSDIWDISLQRFINQINNHSNLYFICSLRTSYIKKIWQSKPRDVIELKGFISSQDLKEVCQKYFGHYKIKATNFDIADLSIFRTPLLLDLFCKLTNDKREYLVEIELNLDSYLKIFEDYINYLVLEVKDNLKLEQSTSINNGFYNSSTKFLEDNEGELLTDEFSSCFDIDPLVSSDNSIARAVLEGYLVFIKDFIGKPREIVKHTQQAIGGFMIAKKLVSDFPQTQDLIDSSIFKEKLIGKDENKIHQLRFDILKFLVTLKPDLIFKSNSEEINELSWWYIYNTDYANLDDATISHITRSTNIKDKISIISDASSPFWFNKDHPHNFDFINNILKTFSQWDYDLSWNQFIYSLASEMRQFIKDYNKSLSEDHDQETLLLKTKFIITLLSSNIRELRDLATGAILKFGIKYSKNLLDLSLDSKSFKDIYIYERMILCCYGVTLKNQNDDSFVNDVLPIYAEDLFKIQFAQNTERSVYNYIVTDSIKHIIDLSILKGVFELSAENLKRVSDYKFTIPFLWIEPTEIEQTIIDESGEMNPPAPLKMDFEIYTIPRLIDRENTPIKIAIANVWSRINQLGFKILDSDQEYDQVYKDFHRGYHIYKFKSKVDRLGKKYCWIAFFDYAGKLLLESNLDVRYKGDSLYEPHYERLGDVDIDISKPNNDCSINQQLFFEDLLSEKRKGKSKWNQIDKTDLVEKLFTQSFETVDFTLLYGFIDQKQDDSYETRSFLLIESIFIDKDELPNLIDIENNLYDWEDDISMSPNNLSDVYFGELYWADSVPSTKTNSENFPTGTYEKGKKTLNKIDLRQDEYKDKNIGDIIEYSRPVKINIETEPTLMDYRWESNSELFKTYDQYIPSSNIGKSLDLKSDCVSGNILDKDLNIATKSIKYEDENYFSSNYSFLRTDLLKEYMDKNNLALVYQVKQHSYSKSSIHYRKLKFFLYE
ncbi:AAA family ATPase [Tenacibaculum ovolyticum]|uniref:AAA family ATPase n=1 Tax=Tenacibaculum ovolyticum TaxID=104270 RepID=UPI001F35AC61|nr:ATP-binding protein [Tenacibaculum ovolyticum]